MKRIIPFLPILLALSLLLSSCTSSSNAAEDQEPQTYTISGTIAQVGEEGGEVEQTGTGAATMSPKKEQLWIRLR